MRIICTPPWLPEAIRSALADKLGPGLLSRRSGIPPPLSLLCPTPCADPPADAALSWMPTLELRQGTCCAAWSACAKPLLVTAVAALTVGYAVVPGCVGTAALVATFCVHQAPNEERNAGGAAAKLPSAAPPEADTRRCAKRCMLLESAQHSTAVQAETLCAVFGAAPVDQFS
jgi:hypothetical protein